jgi:regulator of protease activity HflC (stomatin/prohibitin superfamily)
MKGMGFSNVRDQSRALTNPWQRWMIGGGLLLPLWIIFSSVAVIPTGKRGVVTYFGKVQNQILDEGIHFKLPFGRISKCPWARRICKLLTRIWP